MPNRSEIIANAEGRVTTADMAVKGIRSTNHTHTHDARNTADSRPRVKFRAFFWQKQVAPYD